MKHHSERNVHIYTIIMLILIRKIIKIKNYVWNEYTIALLEGKLINTTESIFNIKFYMTRTSSSLVAWLTVKGLPQSSCSCHGELVLLQRLDEATWTALQCQGLENDYHIRVSWMQMTGQHFHHDQENTSVHKHSTKNLTMPQKLFLYNNKF